MSSAPRAHHETWSIGVSGNPIATPLRPSATRIEPNVCPRSASSRSAFSMCGGWFGADIEASLETLRFSEIARQRTARWQDGFDGRCRPSRAPSGAAEISRARSDSPAHRGGHRLGAARCPPQTAASTRPRCLQTQATTEARLHRFGASAPASEVLNSGCLSSIFPPQAPAPRSADSSEFGIVASLHDRALGVLPRASSLS